MEPPINNNKEKKGTMLENSTFPWCSADNGKHVVMTPTETAVKLSDIEITPRKKSLL